MKKYFRFIVVLAPLALWLISETSFIWPNLFYLDAGLSAVLIVASLFYLSKKDGGEPWWETAILPVSFYAGLSVYASIQINGWLVQFLFLALAIFIYNYLKNLYYFWHRPELYQEDERNIIRSYGSFLAIFLLSCDIYGLQALVSAPVWPMVAVFAVFVAFLLSFLDLRLPHLPKAVIWQFTGLVSWLVVASAFAVSLLPLSYNVLGLVIGITYYLIVNLTRLHLLGALSKNKIKLYITISLTGLLIILLTARWL